MAQVIPQTRLLSEVEPDRGGLLTPVEKKPKLEVGVEHFEEQPVASTSTVAATAKQKSVNGWKQSKKKVSKQKHLLPARTRMRMYWSSPTYRLDMARR